jgi:hypothetical protein
MLTYFKIFSSHRKVLCKSVVLGYYYAVAHFLAALCYASECRLFDSRWGHWDFLLNPSGLTVVLGSTQRLTEMNTRRFTWG